MKIMSIAFLYLVVLLVGISWFFSYYLGVMSGDVDRLRARIEGNVHNEWVTKEVDL
jgi:hypothetical protein